MKKAFYFKLLLSSISFLFLPKTYSQDSRFELGFSTGHYVHSTDAPNYTINPNLSFNLNYNPFKRIVLKSQFEIGEFKGKESEFSHTQYCSGDKPYTKVDYSFHTKVQSYNQHIGYRVISRYRWDLILYAGFGHTIFNVNASFVDLRDSLYCPNYIGSTPAANPNYNKRVSEAGKFQYTSFVPEIVAHYKIKYNLNLTGGMQVHSYMRTDDIDLMNPSTNHGKYSPDSYLRFKIGVNYLIGAPRKITCYWPPKKWNTLYMRRINRKWYDIHPDYKPNLQI